MRVTGALLGLCVLGLAAVAQADVAPGPRPTPTPPPVVPPDPTCLESAVRGEGETCSRCQSGDAGCVPRMEAAGFEVRCAAGSYVILCAPSDREPPPAEVAKDPAVANDPAKEDPPVAETAADPWPPSTDAGGCTCNASGPAGAAVPLALAALALLLAIRRR